MKFFKYTGTEYFNPGPWAVKSKIDLMLKAQDHIINHLMRLYNFSLSKKELLDESERICKQLENKFVEVPMPDDYIL